MKLSFGSDDKFDNKIAPISEMAQKTRNTLFTEPISWASIDKHLIADPNNSLKSFRFFPGNIFWIP